MAAWIHGKVKVRSVVSQGCRPIGQPFVVTRVEGNVIHEMGGVPPLARLQEIYASLSESERLMLRHGLHVGRVLSEYQDEFQRGDFLMRNVTGADPNVPAPWPIGDFIRPGQTVQFHIRDEQTADEDLRKLLRAARIDRRRQFQLAGGAVVYVQRPWHAVVFLFRSRCRLRARSSWAIFPWLVFSLREKLVPVAGKNFLHGFTASVALFETVK